MAMSNSSVDPGQAVQRKQQLDAKRLLNRLEQIQVQDLTIHYSLEASSVTLPGVLIRFLALAVLFRLNSAKKWHMVLRREILPEPVRQWLQIESLVDLVDQATVDWIRPKILLDTLSWHVTECLTQCGLPQPVAVTRQTIRDLLLRDANRCGEGITLNRNFWRRVAEKGRRPLSAVVEAECQERIEFVLGQVDLSEVTARRWLDIPELSEAERAKLEAVRVAEPSERLQALTLAFEQGQFDFVANLLVCSYSRVGRRAHHPLLMLQVWLATLAVGTMCPAGFLRAVDDSVQLRLFLGVMNHGQLPSARRIKGFATERLSPVIEYLVLWHHFLLIGDEGIEIGADFGTDAADMHAQGRMKSDAAAKHLTPLLGWLIGECRRFCQATGRDDLIEADREVLIEAFKQLDWKALGSFGHNRQTLIRAISDTFKGGLVTPLPSPVELNGLPRDGPIPTDLATFAKGLAAEFFERLKVFGEKFGGGVYYDPECSAHTKRGKTVYGYGVQFLADLKFGLISAFAVFPAGDGFRPEIADWVIETKQIFGWGPIQLTSDREYTIAKAIHQWHGEQIFHYGPRADIDRKKKGIFVEEDFDVHEFYAICPNGTRLNRKPHVFVRGSSEQWRYQAKKNDCQGCPRRAECTTGKGPRMLCVNVYGEDLEIHAARMKADPERTRDLMGRHRAMSEGMVNILMNHQGVRHARWKGLAPARLQVGLAIIMQNTLKWYKIRQGQLAPMTLKPAA
jgi:hypothetical protein